MDVADPHAQLPGADDNTSNTLMSYTHSGGTYPDFRPYDAAALLFLYGDDGLGGTLGVQGSGRYRHQRQRPARGQRRQRHAQRRCRHRHRGVLGQPRRLHRHWQSSTNGTSWSAISRATASTFRPAQAEVGKLLRVVASYTDGAGRAESSTSAANAAVANVNDAPTGSVTISGAVRQNGALSTTQSLADVDGLGALSYRWQSSSNGSSWTDITGTTATTFTPGAAQVGQQLRVVVSCVDGGATSESVPSAATVAVVAANASPTGSVSVSGNAQQGVALLAAHTLADVDGLGSVSWRWQSSSNGSSWSDIAGATGASLTLQQAQVGQLLRAVASYTDGKGTAESVPSAATTAVANVNDAPAGQIRLPSSVAQGALLQPTSTLSDADGLGPLA